MFSRVIKKKLPLTYHIVESCVRPIYADKAASALHVELSLNKPKRKIHSTFIYVSRDFSAAGRRVTDQVSSK